MLWFLIATFGYLLLAINFVLDKIIVSKSVSKPVVYTFYSTIFMVGALVALPLIQFDTPRGIDWIWTAVCGIAFGFGLWTVYKALSYGEMSHINPFNGAMVTIATYLFASVFLSENLSFLQTVGIGILVVASLLLSFEKSRAHNGFHIGFVWALVSGILFAISHTAAKYLYTQYDFWTALVWSRAFIAVVGVVALCFPSVWKSFTSKRKKQAKSYAKRNALQLIIFNKILAVIQVVVLQYAIFLGSVTIVNALAGLQYAFMFIIVILLTKFSPTFFKEYFTKSEFIIQVCAILLVAIGSALFVF